MVADYGRSAGRNTGIPEIPEVVATGIPEIRRYSALFGGRNTIPEILEHYRNGISIIRNRNSAQPDIFWRTHEIIMVGMVSWNLHTWHMPSDL